MTGKRGLVVGVMDLAARQGGVAGVLAFGLVFAGCTVDEHCFGDSDCVHPRVCDTRGICVLECTHDGDCGDGYACEAFRCVPSIAKPDVAVDIEGDAPVFECPEDMVMVAGAYCVDRYEASRPDATEDDEGSNGSMALSRPGVMPWRVLDNATAQAACEAVGKRLCSPAEWEVACQGSDGTVYGYGDDYEPHTCNGIDTFGGGGFHLDVTGAFPGCTNEWGVFDMNGNLWEHVLGGTDKTIRGGAYNCGDSKALHRCDYVPATWTPSARGFRCCRALVPLDLVEPVGDQPEPVVDAWEATIEVVVDEGMPDQEIPGCIDEDVGPTDPGSEDPGPADPGQPNEGINDPGSPDEGMTDPGLTDDGMDDPGPPDPGTPDPGQPEPCPPDMVPVQFGPDSTPYCMDQYEASHADASETDKGTSPMAASQAGVLPWHPVTLLEARDACLSAGKRLCKPDEWFDACRGSPETVYSYGDDYHPTLCNGIDAFCHCDAAACLGLPECPYPHCYNQQTPDGLWGPCGAAFHVTPTGSFDQCVNEWGVHDINGNVWELVDTDDGLEHFRGGAYNCGNSEALHRCDHDGSWGPSARGFRCCADVKQP
ncbi:MAG: SUMF1/EgtB/PvdO family nonheme iron enzyme [Deltaproteobacteria bacterium]|nr:SUMF1/EgtB/PvdO family nonheme iron enzyme [Deltaproteobacteria bacterium]